MKKNLTYIIIALILGLIALITITTRKQGTIDKKHGEFAVTDTASITKIYMVDKNNREVLLQRSDSSHSQWTVNNKFIARNEGLVMLMSTISNLRVKAPVSKAGYNTVIRQLASNSVKVEVYQIKPRINIFDRITLFPREKLTKVFYVGHSTQDNMGNFMLLEGSEIPFIVYLPGLRGFVSPRFSTNENDWRDYTIFKIPLDEFASAEVDFFEKQEESFRIQKDEISRFTITSPTTNSPVPFMDTLRILNYVNGFRDIRFEDILNDLGQAFIDSVKNTQPVYRLVVRDTKNREYKVTTYRIRSKGGDFDENGNLLPYNPDRMFALVNDDKDFVLVQYFVFEKLTVPLSRLVR